MKSIVLSTFLVALFSCSENKNSARPIPKDRDEGTFITAKGFILDGKVRIENKIIPGGRHGKSTVIKGAEIILNWMGGM